MTVQDELRLVYCVLYHINCQKTQSIQGSQGPCLRVTMEHSPLVHWSGERW